jgi:hypothetical protein
MSGRGKKILTERDLAALNRARPITVIRPGGRAEIRFSRPRPRKGN